jgi:DNA polymerase-3 subunit beta
MGRGRKGVHQNLVVDCRDGAATFLGTNCEAMVKATCEVKVRREGRTTVPAKMLVQIAKLMPAMSVVTFEVDERGNVQVSCGEATYVLKTLPHELCPEWASREMEAEFTMPAPVLHTMLESVSFAIAAKDYRKVLTGCLLQLDGHAFSATGADGKRVARMTVNVPEVEGSASSVVLPKQAVQALLSLLVEGYVKVGLSRGQASFELPGLVLETNAIPGDYPNVMAVIPQNLLIEIPFDRDVLATMVRRAVCVSGWSVMVDGKGGKARLVGARL